MAQLDCLFTLKVPVLSLIAEIKGRDRKHQCDTIDYKRMTTSKRNCTLTYFVISYVKLAMKIDCAIKAELKKINYEK